MRVLLIHQNFPGQFKHLVAALRARGDDVIAMGMRDPKEVAAAGGAGVEGMRYIRNRGSCNTATDGHPWTRDFDSKVIRGAATLSGCMQLRTEGWEPDAVIAHPAWGEAMFVPEVFPRAKLLLYCEMLYAAEGLDSNFDPEFVNRAEPVTDLARLKIRCLAQSILWEQAAGGMSPTQFQAATFPSPMREKISVIHDGIDTDVVAPATPQVIRTSTGVEMKPGDEVITFVNRNLEPLRGYHRFMRALPDLLRRRPKAQVIIVGGDGVSYGPGPKGGGSWKELFLNEVRDQLDLSRVHFAGSVRYGVFLNILRMSRLHIYLTYPFVASWSLLEAMALEAPVLANDVGSVTEFVRDGENGLLVDFFDGEALVEKACRLLADPELSRRLGRAARATVVDNYDLKRRCLPRQLAWLDDAVRG